jgi:hypothetical protein
MRIGAVGRDRLRESILADPSTHRREHANYRERVANTAPCVRLYVSYRNHGFAASRLISI